MNAFKSLALSRWRQFENIDLDLSPQLCVLTGPNGCGKTTLLNVLGRHFGWHLNFISSSFVSKKLSRRLYLDAWDAIERDSEEQVQVGTLAYASGAHSRILAPPSGQPQYNLAFDNQQPVPGIHIPSHRPPPSYQRLSTIPIDPKTTQQHYQAYQQFLYQTYGEHGSRNPAAAMKETLISFAVFGEGNSSVQGNPEYAAILNQFQEILRTLLPKNIGFEKLEIRTPDVFLATKSGHFPLESMSGGLNALFAIAWQIHTFGFGQEACTVVIDEPENHLHPSMQREFLPNLSRAFKKYKFVVSTHSPFIVASTPEAAVYALKYNERQRVESERLRETDLAASPEKVLRDILDVPVTMPIWVAAKIDDTLRRYAGAAVTPELIAALRSDLESQGLGNALGDFLVAPSSRGDAQ